MNKQKKRKENSDEKDGFYKFKIKTGEIYLIVVVSFPLFVQGLNLLSP